jgi:hypothetical protein
LEPDAADPPDTEFYHMELLAIYNNLYIAGLGVYHTDPEQDTMDIQLVTSRDGLRWQRAGDRQLFLPLGAPGGFDSHMIMELASNTLLIDDELWIYYTGANAKHYAQHQGAIGLARSATALLRWMRAMVRAEWRRARWLLRESSYNSTCRLHLAGQ